MATVAKHSKYPESNERSSLPRLLRRYKSVPRSARVTFLYGQELLFNSRRLVK